jgi:hypothetical protein
LEEKMDFFLISNNIAKLWAKPMFEKIIQDKFLLDKNLPENSLEYPEFLEFFQLDSWSNNKEVKISFSFASQSF